MIRVVCIVEGDGEVQALPALLRRLQVHLTLRPDLDFARPIRVRRDGFLNNDQEFRRFVAMSGNQAGFEGLVLIVIDADDDCPRDLGSRTLQRAVEAARGARVAVVLANAEFESWFVASAPSLVGCRGFQLKEPIPPDPEARRDAKGWIRLGMPGRSYNEILDAPALCSKMDLDLARLQSRSFRKLCKELCTHLQ